MLKTITTALIFVLLGTVYISAEIIEDSQKYLNVLGYNAGLEDGIYKDRTKRAFVKFYSDKNKKFDGDLDEQEVDFLKYEAYKSQTVNIMIPKDVMHAFHNALPEVKAKHCSANSNWPYKDLSKLAPQPPARIYAYNSRMDNRREVQGAEATDLFILNLSEAYTDAWISN